MLKFFSKKLLVTLPLIDSRTNLYPDTCNSQTSNSLIAVYEEIGLGNLHTENHSDRFMRLGIRIPNIRIKNESTISDRKIYTQTTGF